MGCIFVPINAMVLSQYTGQTLGQVSGLLNLSRQIGGSIGIATISTFLDRFSAQFRNDLRAHVTSVNSETFRQLKQTSAMALGKLQSWAGFDSTVYGLNPGSEGGLKEILGQMEKQVFQLSFNRLMLIIMGAYAFAVIPLFALKLEKKVTTTGVAE